MAHRDGTAARPGSVPDAKKLRGAELLECVASFISEEETRRRRGALNRDVPSTSAASQAATATIRSRGASAAASGLLAVRKGPSRSKGREEVGAIRSQAHFDAKKLADSLHDLIQSGTVEPTASQRNFMAHGMAQRPSGYADQFKVRKKGQKSKHSPQGQVNQQRRTQTRPGIQTNPDCSQKTHFPEDMHVFNSTEGIPCAFYFGGRGRDSDANDEHRRPQSPEPSWMRPRSRSPFSGQGHQEGRSPSPFQRLRGFFTPKSKGCTPEGTPGRTTPDANHRRRHEPPRDASFISEDNVSAHAALAGAVKKLKQKMRGLRSPNRTPPRRSPYESPRSTDAGWSDHPPARGSKSPPRRALRPTSPFSRYHPDGSPKYATPDQILTALQEKLGLRGGAINGQLADGPDSSPSGASSHPQASDASAPPRGARAASPRPGRAAAGRDSGDLDIPAGGIASSALSEGMYRNHRCPSMQLVDYPEPFIQTSSQLKDGRVTRAARSVEEEHDPAGLLQTAAHATHGDGGQEGTSASTSQAEEAMAAGLRAPANGPLPCLEPVPEGMMHCTSGNGQQARFQGCECPGGPAVLDAGIIGHSGNELEVAQALEKPIGVPSRTKALTSARVGASPRGARAPLRRSPRTASEGQRNAPSYPVEVSWLRPAEGSKSSPEKEGQCLESVSDKEDRTSADPQAPTEPNGYQDFLFMLLPPAELSGGNDEAMEDCPAASGPRDMDDSFQETIDSESQASFGNSATPTNQQDAHLKRLVARLSSLRESFECHLELAAVVNRSDDICACVEMGDFSLEDTDAWAAIYTPVASSAHHRSASVPLQKSPFAMGASHRPNLSEPELLQSTLLQVNPTYKIESPRTPTNETSELPASLTKGSFHSPSNAALRYHREKRVSESSSENDFYAPRFQFAATKDCRLMGRQVYADELWERVFHHGSKVPEGLGNTCKGRGSTGRTVNLYVGVSLAGVGADLLRAAGWWNHWASTDMALLDPEAEFGRVLLFGSTLVRLHSWYGGLCPSWRSGIGSRTRLIAGLTPAEHWLAVVRRMPHLLLTPTLAATIRDGTIAAALAAWHSKARSGSGRHFSNQIDTPLAKFPTLGPLSATSSPAASPVVMARRRFRQLDTEVRADAPTYLQTHDAPRAWSGLPKRTPRPGHKISKTPRELLKGVSKAFRKNNHTPKEDAGTLGPMAAMALHIEHTKATMLHANKAIGGVSEGPQPGARRHQPMRSAFVSPPQGSSPASTLPKGPPDLFVHVTTADQFPRSHRPGAETKLSPRMGLKQRISSFGATQAWPLRSPPIVSPAKPGSTMTF